MARSFALPNGDKFEIHNVHACRVTHARRPELHALLMRYKEVPALALRCHRADWFRVQQAGRSAAIASAKRAHAASKPASRKRKRRRCARTADGKALCTYDAAVLVGPNVDPLAALALLMLLIEQSLLGTDSSAVGSNGKAFNAKGRRGS